MTDAARMEAAEKLAATGAMLGLAASLFRSPLTKEQHGFLAEIDFSSDDPILENDACRRGLEAMGAFCRQSDDALHAASVEFHRMFVGPHHLPCAPWSSVYVDQGRLFGPTALAVARVFERYGFVIPEGRHEPSDHIAYELSFLSELNARIVEALSADKASDAQGLQNGPQAASLAAECRSFLIRYVTIWFKDLAKLIAAEDKTGFYAGLAELTEGLLQMEEALLSQIVEA